MIGASSILVGEASARCAGCGYDLAGLGREGRCPECGGEFDLIERAMLAERARRRAARGGRPSDDMREWWERWRPSAWTVAIVLVLLGSAVLLGVFGYAAVHKLAYKMDPQMGCSSGGSGLPF